MVGACLLGAAAWISATHGLGADAHRTPLAIESATSFGFGGAYRLKVECADHVTVEVRPDPSGSGLPEVTVWGRPRVGRCHPDATFGGGVGPRIDPHNPTPHPRKIIDGATSQVVSLQG